MVGLQLLFGVITVIAALISLIVGLPTLSRYFIYYWHTADIKISFETRDCPLFWLELVNTGMNFHNRDSVRYKIEYEIRINRAWEYDSDEINKQYHTQTRGKWHVHAKEEFADRDIILSADSADVTTQRGVPRFPLTPQSESAIVEIWVYPTVEASEFGLPEFFGEITLQPVKKRCVVTDDLEVIFEQHTERYRLDQLHKTMAEHIEESHPGGDVEAALRERLDTHN
ncbi:hypothetical protein [Haloparvum sp. PAK95]|uniref:hypothetical protein n=1 Tax=Haloparvum sp. PAK95 TaxID=3418962 RepID=UPI003D2EDACF